MLEHGGKLKAAAKKYGIPLSQWVDLSTGINPNGWGPKNIPVEIWNRLPENDDDLLYTAQQYYGCDSLLAVAGSQAAIQVLPSILFNQATPKKNIGILAPTYAEHAHAWKKRGHNIIPITSSTVEDNIHKFDILIVVNPNNPTGELIPAKKLLFWHKKLANKNSWLIVDEAFMDCLPVHSMLTKKVHDHLIILRSIGKFFGLAGIRVGFVSGPKKILNNLDEILGPWTIPGPSRLCAQQALADHDWQASNRANLSVASKRLFTLLSECHFPPDGATSLFCWVKTNKAKNIHEALARAGILTRLFSKPNSLRFGLPKNEKQWQKLTSVVGKIS